MRVLNTLSQMTGSIADLILSRTNRDDMHLMGGVAMHLFVGFFAMHRPALAEML